VARFARSAPVHVPPYILVIEDQFITVNFDEDLRGTFLELVPPAKRMAADAAGVRTQTTPRRNFGMAQGAEAERVAGSLFGSMQQVSIHEQAISSTYFPLVGVCGQCLPCLV